MKTGTIVIIAGITFVIGALSGYIVYKPVNLPGTYCICVESGGAPANWVGNCPPQAKNALRQAYGSHCPQ